MSRTKMFTYVLFISLTTISTAITVTGPLVDKYCWNDKNGIAIDTGANLKQNPFVHTIHCLLFSPCQSSGYIIVEKKPGASAYTIQYELDGNGNTLAANYLRSIAPSGSARYSARNGFVISATGTVSGNVLQVTSVKEGTLSPTRGQPVPTMTPSTSAPTTTPVTSSPTISKPPSTTPTSMPSSTPTMVTTKGTLVNLQFGIAVEASANSTHAILGFQGPKSKWFAVGFGTQMINAQAIVSEAGLPLKRFLMKAKSRAQFQEQTPIGFTVLSDSTTSNTRKVSLLFSLPAPTGIDLRQSTSVSIVYASGLTPNLSYHDTSRNITMLKVNVLGQVRPTSGTMRIEIVGVFFLVAFAFCF